MSPHHSQDHRFLIDNDEFRQGTQAMSDRHSDIKGTRMLIGGRFSATYAMRDGPWRIVSHSLETLPLAYAQALPAHSDTSRPN